MDILYTHKDESDFWVCVFKEVFFSFPAAKLFFKLATALTTIINHM